MNHKNTEIIRNFLPLYYLSKIFGVLPLLLVSQLPPRRITRRTTTPFWHRFSRSKISDPGDETKDDILEKFQSYKTYLKESAKLDAGHKQRRIFRLDRVSLVYTYFSVCVVILHGISAPFYVLHTTLPLQYNESIFNIDFDEEEDEEEEDLVTLATTLEPLLTADAEPSGNSSDAAKESIKLAQNILKNSANKRSIDPKEYKTLAKLENISTSQDIHEEHFHIDLGIPPKGSNAFQKTPIMSTHTISSSDRKLPHLKLNATNNTLRSKRNTQTYRNAFNKTYNGNQIYGWRSNFYNLTGYHKKNKTLNGTEVNAVNVTVVKLNDTVSQDPLKYDKETKQSLSMKIANPLMITAMCLGSKFTAIYFLPKSLDSFFSQLLIVDGILKYHPKFHTDQRRFVQNLLIYSFLLSVPINIHYLMTVVEVNNEFGIMWCCILIYTNLSSFLLDLQFIYLNYLLLVRYKYINKQIKIAFNHYSQNNVVLVKSFLIHDYLEILRECHKKLSDLLKILNYIYQIHLLLALSTCFVKLLFNIYFAMFGYVIGTAVPHSDKEATELFRTVLWSMYYAMRFLCVVLSADITGQEARRTNVTVANVHNRHLDPDTKEELSLFGSYVTSRDLKFTAAGFFTLNSHLITSAISTGTTYLVILVQFHGQTL